MFVKIAWASFIIKKFDLFFDLPNINKKKHKNRSSRFRGISLQDFVYVDITHTNDRKTSFTVYI